MSRLFFSILVLILLVGCPGSSQDSLPCPVLPHGSNQVFAHMGNLEPGVSRTLALKDKDFAGHSVAVPLAGQVTLTATVLIDDSELKPTLFIYGPRRGDGLFGTCVELNGLGVAGEQLSIQYDVPADQGGEYLVLVGANPPSKSIGQYTVTVECVGDGCKQARCPTFESLGCPDKVCPGGFATVETDDGLMCPTCECEERLCGPFKKLIFDQCVCDCPAPGPGMAVCGADGKTWPSKCHATCKEVPVANEDGPCSQVCPGLKDCPEKCEIGHVVVNGCATCQCAEKCDQVSGVYRPVCGYDGLTYTNADVARCKDVKVAYVGSCLPFCSLPPGCDLNCKNGLLPNPGIGEECFKCACMEADAKPDKGQCTKGDAQWCARYKPPKGQGKSPVSVPSGNDQQALAKSAKGLQLTRTFINMCAAKAAGWKPIVASACPTGVCQQPKQCEDAQSLLDESIDVLSEPQEVPSVDCVKAGDKSSKESVGVCAYKPPERVPCSDGNECPSGVKCIPGPGGQGAFCEGSCPCLYLPGSGVYDPVCVGGTTYYNACFAFCAAAWPIEHPGSCCSSRLPVADVAMTYVEINKQCLVNNLVADIRLDSACPPSADFCADPNNQEECCKPFLGQQPNGK